MPRPRHLPPLHLRSLGRAGHLGIMSASPDHPNDRGVWTSVLLPGRSSGSGPSRRRLRHLTPLPGFSRMEALPPTPTRRRPRGALRQPLPPVWLTSAGTPRQEPSTPAAIFIPRRPLSPSASGGPPRSALREAAFRPERCQRPPRCRAVRTLPARAGPASAWGAAVATQHRPPGGHYLAPLPAGAGPPDYVHPAWPSPPTGRQVPRPQDPHRRECRSLRRSPRQSSV